MGGEHAATVNGKGRNVTVQDLLYLAKAFGLNARESSAIAQEVQAKAAPLPHRPPPAHYPLPQLPTVPGTCI